MNDGIGGPSDLVECLGRAIDHRPDHAAIVFADHRLTFAQLGTAVQLCAQTLGAEGLGTESAPASTDPILVGLRLGRTPEYVIAYLTLAALGATIVPFDDETPDREVVTEAQRLRLKALITNRPLTDIAGCIVIPVAPDDQGTEPIPWTGTNEQLTNLPRSRWVRPDLPLILLKTSGSTSRPKRVVLSHRNALASSRAHRASVEHGPDEVSLVALPMSYGYCHTTQLVAQIDTGGTLALLPGTFLARTFAEAVSDARATTTTLVPAMLTLLAKASAGTEPKLKSLRSIVFGGASVGPALLDQLRSRYPWVELIETYGQTEAGPRIATMRAADARLRPGSVGCAVPGMRIVICSTSTGETLPFGEVGEVVVRGDGVMSGYHGDPAATADVLRDGWLHTGDLGRLDEQGFLYLAGRLRNLIITAGRNVNAEEIEEYLRQIPGIADAAVFGEPDELRGETIHAAIVARTGAFPVEGEIRAFLVSRLERYKLPHRISFVGELPRTENGKIDRPSLGRLVAAASAGRRHE
jgi:acyl-CoA synthetase (AMP-forming)/AMP-acid ligase II